MLVFIDESGDPGFKLARGSSPVFAVAMIIFDDSNAARRADNIVRTLKGQIGTFREFKFSKCSSANRDRFFDATATMDFRIRADVFP